jgi:hypothetical protein
MYGHKTTGFPLLLLLLAGCAYNQNPPLVFGQAQSVGITINASTTTQGGELTLGYRDIDMAIIPATTTQAGGAVTQVQGVVTDGSANSTDALSVLGQFQVNTQAAAPQASLGKFFATGVAAQKLADGFAANLGLTAPIKPSPQPLAPGK